MSLHFNYEIFFQVSSKEKKRETEALLGPLAEERFALLMNLGKKITDFGHDPNANKVSKAHIIHTGCSRNVYLLFILLARRVTEINITFFIQHFSITLLFKKDIDHN